jgi:hypothetical protein
MGFLDKLFGKSKINDATASTVITESAPLASTQTNTKPKKPRKPTAAKVEEPVAEVQPEVRVLKFDFDPQNPQIGSMELDWNAEFIEMLRQAGYRGVNPEALVDAWLNDIARNIINSSQSADGTNRYVSRRDLGDGFSEIR